MLTTQCIPKNNDINSLLTLYSNTEKHTRVTPALVGVAFPV